MELAELLHLPDLPENPSNEELAAWKARMGYSTALMLTLTVETGLKQMIAAPNPELAKSLKEEIERLYTFVSNNYA